MTAWAMRHFLKMMPLFTLRMNMRMTSTSVLLTSFTTLMIVPLWRSSTSTGAFITMGRMRALHINITALRSLSSVFILGTKMKKITSARSLVSLTCILDGCCVSIYCLSIKNKVSILNCHLNICVLYSEIQLNRPIGSCVHSASFMGQHVSSMVVYKFVRLTAGGSDWMVMPLFLCGCAKGPELLTNTPVTHGFPCASTLYWPLFYSISHRTSCAL